MQCPSCAAPASEGQSHCARCHTSLSALAGAYAAPTSSTEKTIMFDRAPWPQAEEPTGSWTPVPPAGSPAETPVAPVSGTPGSGLPVPAAPAPGESTEWWTPAMDEASGPVPLPQQQAWAPQPAAPQVPETPAVPVVPDSWFAGPAQEQPAGGPPNGTPQTQTGPFVPVFDETPEPAAPPVVFPADSTFAAMGAPDTAQPGHPGALAAEPPHVPPVPQNGLAAGPPHAQPEYVQPEYTQPEYVQPEYTQPEYAQPHAPASGPPYVASAPQNAYEQPQQGFAPVPSPAPMGGPGGFPQPPAWGAPREENPRWEAGGPPTAPSHPSPAAGGRAKNKPLLIGVAALVTVAVASVAFVFLNGEDEKKKLQPSQPPVAQQPVDAPAAESAAAKQARKVQALLNASAKSRGVLGGALVQARKCKGLPSSISAMQQVAQQRQSQWQRARRLDIAELPDAAKLRDSLARSFKLSLDVDLAYLAWARGNQGCKGKTPPKGADYKRGAALSAQATQAKSNFLKLWNPVAPQYGLPKRKSF
ncbi:hypothetical protein [Actinocorallia populi]|uniref:hypothetical protein n=1 Tax=Actinocorallia populi TaxID=2079200 RepID=UPI0013008852|nr:hypothetical protein [Actinocorallia populi]